MLFLFEHSAEAELKDLTSDLSDLTSHISHLIFFWQQSLFPTFYVVQSNRPLEEAMCDVELSAFDFEYRNVGENYGDISSGSN